MVLLELLHFIQLSSSGQYGLDLLNVPLGSAYRRLGKERRRKKTFIDNERHTDIQWIVRGHYEMSP